MTLGYETRSQSSCIIKSPFFHSTKYLNYLRIKRVVWLHLQGFHVGEVGGFGWGFTGHGCVGEVAEFVEVSSIEAMGGIGDGTDVGLGGDDQNGFIRGYDVMIDNAVGIADVGGGVAGKGLGDNCVFRNAVLRHDVFFHFDGFAILCAFGVHIAA